VVHPRDRAVRAPVAGKRLVGVDAARGVALIAMMAVHLLPGMEAGGDPSWSDQIARGRAAAAFALLAGVALALANGRGQPLQGRAWASAGAGLLVRCVCIAVIGFALGMVDSGLAIILVNYALLFALAIPLLGLRAPALATLAVAVTVLVPVWSHVVRADLAPMRGASPVFVDITEPATLLSELMLTGYYPVLSWVAYLAAGIAVGRLDLADRRTAARLLLGGAALAVVAVVASQQLLQRPEARTALPAGVAEQVRYGTAPPTTWWWLAIVEPHSTTPFDLAHTIGTALALLGGCLLLAPLLGRWMVPVAWAGSMTLTLYSLHVLAVAAAPVSEHPGRVWAIQVVLAVGFAAYWRSSSQRGPLEQLVAWPAQWAAAAVRTSGR
jgi:uncharacterized membrane protein